MAVIWLIILLLLPAVSESTVLLQDGFETSVSIPWDCTGPEPTGWYSTLGVISDCSTDTYDSATHYSMEISAGTGQTGRGLLFYRHGTYPNDRLYSMLNEDIYDHSATTLYVGWHMKLPSSMTAAGLSYLKLWRGLASSGSNQDWYLNINGDGDSLAASGRLQFISDGYDWKTLLTNPQLDAVRDDQWHYYQVRMTLNSPGSSDGVIEFWLDGTQHTICDGDGTNCVNSKAMNFTAISGTVFSLFSFGVGNNNGVTWQTGWVPISMDNLVIATTKAETDQGGGGGDTTPPVISSPSPSGTLAYGTTSTSMTVTTNENATCKYGTSDVAYASLPNTFSTTGTTSHSQTISGLTNGGSYTYYVRCLDSSSNADTSSTAISFNVSNTAPAPANLLLSEDFEDSSFSGRDWYDGTATSGAITTSEHQSGTHSYICAFNNGGLGCSGGNPGRHLFTATDTLYIDYYIKFATGWRGSQQTYHPHMFYFLSDADGVWDGPANNYLSTYIEFSSDVGSPYTIRPQIALQDEKNVNTSYGTPPNDLSATTENRSVNYCNTPVSTGADGTCYADTTYYSANTWKASTASVSTDEWHHVRAYFKMNTVSDGVGQHDGIMREWIDGVQVINSTDVLYRTNQRSTLKWNQFILGPYIGDGAPIAQTFYIDNLNIYDGIPVTAVGSMGGVSASGVTFR